MALPTTIREAAKSLRDKSISARELAQSCLDAITTRESEVDAYLEVFDDVLIQADHAQQGIDSGAADVLLGIPLAIKDNIVQEGRIATAGSKILESFIASYDATVISKLKASGAVLLGRTNLDEFAMGSSTEHSAYKQTKNPHDLSRVPGGSSGGSAAAVAMGGAFAALGSDTGGSVRQPASFCGIVGLKPTYGSVSRSGLIAMGSSLDVIGPLTKTVTDAKILFEAIRGKDSLDATSHDGLRQKKAVQRIGVPRAYLEDGLDADVRIAFDQSLKALAERGYEIVDIALPNIDHALAAYYIIMPAEVSTNLARYDGVKYGLHVETETLLGDYLKTRAQGFGTEVRRRMLLGTYVLSSGYYDAYYGKAQLAREQLTNDFKEAFTSVDVIATPTTPTPAFKLGEKNDPLTMYLEDIFTVPANITGIPGISVPMGMVSREDVHLPVGLQLLAPHNEEERLFTVGSRFLGES